MRVRYELPARVAPMAAQRRTRSPPECRAGDDVTCDGITTARAAVFRAVPTRFASSSAPRDESFGRSPARFRSRARTASELKLYLMRDRDGCRGLSQAVRRTHSGASAFTQVSSCLAGFTPLDVNALRRRGASRDGDYLRAASTGPMAPMVVAVTRAGAALRIGITYRTAALERDDVRTVIASLQQSIDSLP